MKKFKVFDNATFAFMYTFNNIKEFYKKEKKSIISLFLVFFILFAISLCGFLNLFKSLESVFNEEGGVISEQIISNPLYNDIITLDDSPTSPTYEQEAELNENNLAELKKEGKKVLIALLDELKESKTIIGVYIMMFILSKIVLWIISFKWFRFCYKSKYLPSIKADYFNVLRVFLIYIIGGLFMVLFSAIVCTLIWLAFLLNKPFGVLLLMAGGILLTILHCYISVAMDLMISGFVLSKGSYDIISLLKAIKGNVIRMITVSFLISVVFSILNWVINVIVSPLPEHISFLPLYLTIFALVLLSRSLISATLSFVFYKGIVDNDDNFMI